MIKLTTASLPHTAPASTSPLPEPNLSRSAFDSTFAISITLTAVSRSPFSRTCCIGAGPRYAGNADGCTFSRRDAANAFNREDERMRPKDAVTSTFARSGGEPENRANGSGRRQVLNAERSSGMRCTGTSREMPRVFSGANAN